MKRNDWMEALEAAMATTGDDGTSVAEIAEQIGKSHNYVHDLLRVLKNQGRLGVGHRRSVGISGRPCQTPVYWIMKAARRPAKDA